MRMVLLSVQAEQAVVEQELPLQLELQDVLILAAVVVAAMEMALEHVRVVVLEAQELLF